MARLQNDLLIVIHVGWQLVPAVLLLLRRLASRRLLSLNRLLSDRLRLLLRGFIVAEGVGCGGVD